MWHMLYEENNQLFMTISIHIFIISILLPIIAITSSYKASSFITLLKLIFNVKTSYRIFQNMIKLRIYIFLESL